MAEQIVAREGGFVDDPDDPGGATKHGVTIDTARRLGIDKTGDGRVTVEDVRQLTREDAVEIFLQQYFHAPRIADLPVPLQATVFDMQVNAGANAVRILQRVLRDLGRDVATDGVIGPNTLTAAQDAFARTGELLVDSYGIARRNYYFRLADRRPALRKFARTRSGGKGGWIRRAEDFIAPKFRMSAAQFRERTAKWD